MSTEKGIRRKDLITSLITGLAIGLVAGTPIGWFAHRFYNQQRTAQVLLCRQKHVGEVNLDAICGSLY
ncbi:MAG: hypothetical protein KME08_05215 [Aphanothece sp. CMT-3BRIN-NPC111]|jgi:uncharacterized membrane-anchored protein YhcB (DUF1043 family)|nr:hypothetical protein [Aphanothece sp. CMT-3BRIN-NPC111]